MILRSYIPRPPLSDFVDLLWLYEGYAPPHAKERLLPGGTVELVISLREETMRVYDRRRHERFESFRGCLVMGPQSEFNVIDTSTLAVMGVHFKPGGAFPFFRVPACELQDETVQLDTLWGASASELRERLLEAATVEEKFRILEQALLGQATRPLARHQAVAFALRELRGGPQSRTVSNVTWETGLSARRFIQVFSEEVGLTPKLFSRVQRFQKVLSHIGTAQTIEWADVAVDYGYFDQSHFIHDFQSFAGINPSTYLAHRTEHLNHVPLYD
ncbi:MAG: helix-turn-helix domain-containing protein [Rubrivivax sp.]|nr:helix-turn-helix domain-containing protein [Pyrinomonadaceae bacterium]